MLGGQGEWPHLPKLTTLIYFSFMQSFKDILEIKLTEGWCQKWSQSVLVGDNLALIWIGVSSSAVPFSCLFWTREPAPLFILPLCHYSIHRGSSLVCISVPFPPTVVLCPVFYTSPTWWCIEMNRVYRIVFVVPKSVNVHCPYMECTTLISPSTTLYFTCVFSKFVCFSNRNK